MLTDNFPLDEFKTMKYGSVCSGIEAASVAWEPLGWEAQWYAEIEHFPSAVLAHRFPTVPNLGDMTKIHETKHFQNATIDLLVGGTPCQSFSVAGLRKGLDDPRGNLMLTFLSLAGRKKPRWIVWENVPGVLSSNKGRDFGTFLTALGQLGYGFAYRVLDAQYFGVAQRRRRVFVVAYLGDWRPAAAVLFERNSLSGHPPKGREKREATSADAQGGSGGGGKSTGVNPELMATLCAKDNEKWGCNQWVNEGKAIVEPKASALLEPKTTLFATSGQSNAVFSSDVALTLNANNDLPYVTHAFKVRGGSEDNTGEQGGTPGKKAGKGYLGQDEKAFTIGTTQDQQIAQPIAFKEPCPTITAKMQGSSGWAPYNETDHLVGQPVPFRKVRRAQSTDDHETWEKDETANTINTFDVGDVRTTQAVLQPNIAPTLTASNDPSRSPQSSEVTNQIKAVYQALMAIRRLTPTECERLQGFPDDWTLIPYRNKPADQCPDGPRYKACGNSMAVPVMRWIGERIQMVESI